MGAAAAIATFVFTAGASVGGALLTGALVAGANYISSKLLKPDLPKPSGLSNRVRGYNITSRQTAPSRRWIAGYRRVGGFYVYMNTWGQRGEVKNYWLGLVIAFCGHRVKQIGSTNTALKVSGLLHGNQHWSLKPPDGTNRYVVGAAALNLPTYKGDTRLGGDEHASFTFSNTPPVDWTAQHKLLGIASVQLQLPYSESDFPNQLENIRADILGDDRIVDPRTGRASWTRNPALITAWFIYLRKGISYWDSERADYGLDKDCVIAAANVCDEAVPTPYGTEHRYLCDAVIDSDEGFGDTLSKLLASFNSDVYESGGFLFFEVPAAETPQMVLKAEDLRGEVSFSFSHRQKDVFNVVKATYAGPNSQWELTEVPEVLDAEDIQKRDGQRLVQSIHLPYTISPTGCERLAFSLLQRSKFQKTVRLKCKASALPLRAGSVLAIDGQNRPAWPSASTHWRVAKYTLVPYQENGTPAIGVDLELAQLHPDMYAAPPLSLYKGERFSTEALLEGYSQDTLPTYTPLPPTSPPSDAWLTQHNIAEGDRLTAALSTLSLPLFQLGSGKHAPSWLSLKRQTTTAAATPLRFNRTYYNSQLSTEIRHTQWQLINTTEQLNLTLGNLQLKWFPPTTSFFPPGTDVEDNQISFTIRLYQYAQTTPLRIAKRTTTAAEHTHTQTSFRLRGTGPLTLQTTLEVPYLNQHHTLPPTLFKTGKTYQIQAGPTWTDTHHTTHSHLSTLDAIAFK